MTVTVFAGTTETDLLLNLDCQHSSVYLPSVQPGWREVNPACHPSLVLQSIGPSQVYTVHL